MVRTRAYIPNPTYDPNDPNSIIGTFSHGWADLGPANNDSWGWTFAKSFFGDFSLKSARAPGKSFTQRVSRVRDAGDAATAAVDSVLLLSTASSLGSWQAISRPVIGGVKATFSTIEVLALEGMQNGALSANTFAAATKLSGTLGKYSPYVIAGAVGAELGILGACR